MPAGIMTSALGAIQAASSTAFSDLAGSFVVLSTISYGETFWAFLN